MSHQPLLVIVGPTASGKTHLALEIAQQYDGEIISADSRTVYKGLDIGTAKPTKKEQSRIPHHLIDVVEPNQTFTVWDFQQLAKKAIADIRARGKLPILVGGTGLYIDSIVFDYAIDNAPLDVELRQRLTDESIENLQMMIKEQHLKMPENALNKRHLIRALEQKKINTARRSEPIEHTIIVGIATEKLELEQRIRSRAQTIFDSGVIQEAEKVASLYGWDTPAMTGNIYPIIRQLVDGTISIDTAIEKFVISDRQLAKRQLTWLKRNKYIVWKQPESASKHIDKLLSTYHRQHSRTMLR